MKNLKINIYLIASVIIPFIIYLLTFPRENGLADSGLFSAAIVDLGIPLPPGFPTYLILGHLLTKLPFSLNTNLYLLSIFASSITLALIFSSVKLLCGKNTNKFTNLAALITTISVAFSYQFWSGTNNIEAFPLTITFIFLILFLLLKTRELIIKNDYKLNQNIKKLIIYISLTLGIASGLNPIIIFSFAPLAIFILFFKDLLIKNKKFIFYNLLFIIFLIIITYSYLPLRALQNPYLNFGNPITLASILDLMSGKGFVSKNGPTEIIGFTLNLEILLKTLTHYLRMLFIQFNPILLLVSGMGAFKLKNKQSSLLMVVSVFLTSSILGILYISGNQEYWFLPSFIALALLFGVGLNSLLNQTYSKINQVPEKLLIAIIIGISLLPLFFWFNSLNRAGNNITSVYIANLYSNIERNAVLIGGGNIFEGQTAYAKFVNKTRPDIFPFIGNFYYDFEWYRQNISKSQDIQTSTALKQAIIKSDKNNQENILVKLIKENPKKSFYIDKSYLLNYAPNILKTCSATNCKLEDYFLIDNGITFKISQKLVKPNRKIIQSQLKYRPLFEQFPNSQIEIIKNILTLQRLNSPKFTLTYPADLTITEKETTLSLNNPKTGLNISLEQIPLNSSLNYETTISTDSSSYGTLVKQGRAEIPNTSFAYVKIFNDESVYLFYLFYGDKLIKALVSPASKDNLQTFDNIISSLKFP